MYVENEYYSIDLNTQEIKNNEINLQVMKNIYLNSQKMKNIHINVQEIKIGDLKKFKKECSLFFKTQVK